jgi:hypothetical protein
MDEYSCLKLLNMVCGFTPKYWVKKFLYPGYGVKPVKNQGDWQKIFKIAAAAGIK